jgi:ribose-phosphate pyrophosphokinase
VGRSKVSRFSDGETFCVIEENVRGVDTYVVQPTCSPVNDNVMELLIMVDALRRASAGSITAVIPYYGYARQDRKVAPRTPITSKLVADLIVAAGVNRIVALDLHAAQIQGFFNIPFDHLFAMPSLLDQHLREHYQKEVVIVSPDAGGVERARAYAKRLQGSLAIIDKRRERANESEVMNIIGEVEGRDCLILDDMIDTAGTLVNAAGALMKAGAKSVAACATHPVLSGPAVQRIKESPAHRGGRHELDPAPRRGEGDREIQGRQRRAPPRGGDPPHPQLGLDQLAVRLSSGERQRPLEPPPPRRADPCRRVRPRSQGDARRVAPKALLSVLGSDHGQNAVVELAIDGGDTLTVMVRDYAYHPISRELLHADFVAVKLDQPVDVDVPFRMTSARRRASPRAASSSRSSARSRCAASPRRSPPSSRRT